MAGNGVRINAVQPGHIAEMSALSDRLVQGRLCLCCRFTGDHPVSRLRESYPEAPAELCVSLSTHTVPIREPSFRFGILIVIDSALLSVIVIHP